MKLNAFPDQRPAFWRTDEFWSPHDDASGNRMLYRPSWATSAQFTLWHFRGNITSAFGDPSLLSDQPSGAYVARYTWPDTNPSNFADLRWYQPPGFDIALYDGSGNPRFQREANGGFYFYLYVQGVSGSTEDNYDLRAGPASFEVTSNDSCTDATIGSPYTTDCYVNQLYFDHAFNSKADWNTGGVTIFAKRALPLNLDTGATFPLIMAQISKYAEGQVLQIRHFDQDCDVTTPQRCGNTMTYQMQICGCSDLNNPSCWSTIPDASSPTSYSIGWLSGTNAWSDGTHRDIDQVRIPASGTAAYNSFFGNGGTCSSSWFRIQSNPSYSQDTTVWEMPYAKPRLVR
jgi:hypothetical protein